MQVYLVALVLKPTQKQVFDEGAVPIIVGGGPHALMADSDTQAAAKAMAFLPDEMRDKADRVEVSLLPFAKAAR